MGEYAVANTLPACSAPFLFTFSKWEKGIIGEIILTILNRSIAHRSVVILCIVFAFVSGVTKLKSDPISPAEFNSTIHIYETHLGQQLSITQTVSRIATVDPFHVPGYFVALNLWSRLVGRDLLTQRMLSLYFGLLTLALTYRFSRWIGGADTALDACLLLTFLSFYEFYVHEARMYSLLPLAASWVVLSYWRVVSLHDKAKLCHWLSLLVSSAAIIYVHYFGFVLLGAIGVYHLAIVPKDKFWLKTVFVLSCAGLPFLPWIPVAITALTHSSSWAGDRLTSFEVVAALSGIYTNGLIFIAPSLAAILIIKRAQLNASYKFVVVLICLLPIGIVIANEFASVVVARRIRYTIVIAPIWICALAIALNLVPKWKLLRVPAMGIWILSFFLYNGSTDLYLYTNGMAQNKAKVPHYQNLIYEPKIVPRKSDFVVSFHIDTPLIDRKTMEYYGRQLGKWRGLIHIRNDDAGNPVVQSTHKRYVDVESMASWNFPIWLIHNPQQTDLSTMEVFTDSFATHFHSCGRYYESDNTVIDLYVKSSIPCELLLSQHPVELHYDNGTELANIFLQHDADDLNIYFWWTNTIANEYAFSSQLFDAQDDKVAQLDNVIGGDPISSHSFDISDLPPGEYTSKLIIYDFDSKDSQSVTIVAGEQRFERAVDVGRISIDE